MTLTKIYPSLKQDHLLSMGSFFYLSLTLGLGSFIKIVGCSQLTNVLGGSTSRFEVKARDTTLRLEAVGGPLGALDELGVKLEAPTT